MLEGGKGKGWCQSFWKLGWGATPHLPIVRQYIVVILMWIIEINLADLTLDEMAELMNSDCNYVCDILTYS